MKSKLIAGFLLLALLCWAFPLPVSGHTAEPNVAPATKEAQETKVIEPIEPSISTPIIPRHTSKPVVSDKVHERLDRGRDYSAEERTILEQRDTRIETYTKEEVQELILSYSSRFGIDPLTPLCIARLESGFNQFSKNKASSAAGVFQYLAGTWAGTDEGKAGLSVFDADANVKAAVKYMAIHKNTRPWVVAPNCPPLSLTK